MPPTFHIENFGCRAARADGEAIAAILRSSGAGECHPAEANVVVVNTCSVTAEADREARAYIRRTHRLNPAARIIATGCYAQRAPQELAEIPGVAAVIGNSHKALAPEIALSLANSWQNLQRRDVHPLPVPSVAAGHDFSRAANADEDERASDPGASSAPSQMITISALLNSSNQPQVLVDDTFAHSFLEEAPILPGAQTRPNLKIQEGCSNRCSFCVIPQTRGNSRSLPAEKVLSQIQKFVAAGGNELVLSGINLGRWGRDLDPRQSEFRTLAALVRAILEQTPLPRLRLSSIEPMDWTSDLIALMSEYSGSRPVSPATGLSRWGGRLARHAHLPLQSGSDSVLRRMHRRYRPWHYAGKVFDLLGAAGPALTIGADVMVGFPGETDNEFEDTYNFIRDLPFGYLHLFPFSPRPGTRAWALHAASPVPSAVVNQRMAILRALASKKNRAHRAKFIGTELDTITLRTQPALASADRTSALSENFIPVELSARLPANQFVRVQITGMDADGTLLAASPVPFAGQSYRAAYANGCEQVLETAF